MKTTRYHLERVVEGATANNIDYIKEEFKAVLQSDNEYTRKADYLGFSILSITDKIKLLDEEINELKEYKAKLNEAKELALEVGANVFTEFGIDKIEGAGISSITLTKESRSSKTSLVIRNEQALMDAGFTKTVLDTDSVLEAFNNGDYQELILQNAIVDTKVTVKPQKLRINSRRIKRLASWKMNY